MSGLEIVGIVLGGFPILLEAAKPLSRYFQSAERWWNFKKDFMSLVSTIEDESIAYSQNLELLLTPIDLDPEAKASMQEDPKSMLWHDPAIQSKLRNRIKSQYFSWFQRQLLEMRDTLDEIYSMLPVKNGEVDFPRATTVEYELFRLKQSLSTRRQYLLDKIVRINESLYKFLAKDSHINAEATRSAACWGQTFPGRFGNSRWSKAKTFLRLQSEAKTLSCALRDRWNCRCPHHPHQCGIRLDWEPSEAGSRDPNLKLLLGSGTPRKGMKQISVEMIVEDELDPIEKASSLPNLTRLDEMSKLQLQARQELAPTSFERRAQQPGVAHSLVSTTSTLISPAISSDLKFWRSREQRKLTKRETYPRLSAQNTSSLTSMTKTVRFSSCSSTSSVSSNRSQTWIGDICSFLNSTSTWTDQQCLKSNQQQAIAFCPEPRDQTSLTKSEIRELEVFYGSTPRLPDRLQVGLEIALTILGLGTSCWIPRGWDRREVFVLEVSGSSNPSVISPFIRHDSLSFTVGEKIEDASLHTQATMFSLGVLLLELIYQETLEKQPFWNKYCDNGQPNDWTHQCTAMEWQSMVEARYGDDLSEPIRLCVEGGFSGETDLEDSGFLQEVINTVINPLERFLSGWGGS